MRPKQIENKPNYNLPSIIRSRRRNLDMTQKELSEKVNVSLVTVSNWEHGNTEPGFNEFIMLCKVLSLKIEDFI